MSSGNRIERQPDIREIRNIPSIHDRILEAAEQGRLVFFLGAGLSQSLGCPDWTGLAQRILRFVYSHRKSNGMSYRQFVDLREEKDPRRLLSICWPMFLEIGQPAFTELEKIFRPKDGYNIYDHIVECDCPIVTTNYDLNLQHALLRRAALVREESGELPEMRYSVEEAISQIIFDSQNLSEHKLRRGIAQYLHGVVNNPDKMIVTTTDYLRHYSYDENSPPNRFFVENLFKKWVVLFLGSSMGELQILEYLAKPGRLRHFMLQGFWRESTRYATSVAQYFNALGVTLIPFAKDEIGHDQLLEILKAWKTDIGKVAARPSSSEVLKEFEDVEL